jgi:LAO/AO transport system kinase
LTTLEDLSAGGKGALARALAAVESRSETPEVAALLDEAWAAPRGHAIGLTGPPGVGKSSLIDALIRVLRGRGETVAVLAVDPSSRRTGGALLGDRTRLSVDPEDAGVFVRSMAARDRLGGVAALTWPALVLTRALFDVVLVETVGVGQSETEIADLADTVIFCAQPGSGDSLQFMKAGVMEIPDIALVTKADMGAPARRAAADMKGALSLAAAGGRDVPVLLCSAGTGEGIEAVADALAARVATRAADGSLARTRRAQAALWARGAMAESVGRFALERVSAALDMAESTAPFQRVAALKATLREALSVGLAQLDGGF